MPGLRPLYRLVRAAGWHARDCLTTLYWRARCASPLGRGPKSQVSQHWGEAVIQGGDDTRGQLKGWLDCEDVLWRYVFPRLGGDDWYRHIAERYCPEPRDLALSLCCGDGHVERDFVNYGLCRNARGIDLSPQAIEACRRLTTETNLENHLSYEVGDVERCTLPQETYDLVIGWMALHHLRRLGHVFRQIQRTLKPGGLLIANEYVGPPHFQLRPEQVELADELLTTIPSELRRLGSGGPLKERCRPAGLVEMLRTDPSEGARSHQILPTLRKYLEVVEQIDYGGCVLMILLSGIAQNFDASKEDDRNLLDRLYAAEREAIESGRLSSDFTFLVARPRR